MLDQFVTQITKLYSNRNVSFSDMFNTWELDFVRSQELAMWNLHCSFKTKYRSHHVSSELNQNPFLFFKPQCQFLQVVEFDSKLPVGLNQTRLNGPTPGHEVAGKPLRIPWGLVYLNPLNRLVSPSTVMPLSYCYDRLLFGWRNKVPRGRGFVIAVRLWVTRVRSLGF